MYNVLKRLFDLLVSAVGIIIILPLFIVISFCIKLTSKGPILFRQIRFGQYAKPFTFYKFRTMCVDNDRILDRQFVKNLINGKYGEIGETPMFKLNNDPRVTPFGRFLRKTALDELPQYLNVLKGDMSLVGPRPMVPFEYDHYEEWHKERLSVKPGMVGLWQVSGRSSSTFDEMIRLDIEYVRKKSFIFDIRILLMTVRVILSGKGAY